MTIEATVNPSSLKHNEPFTAARTGAHANPSRNPMTVGIQSDVSLMAWSPSSPAAVRSELYTDVEASKSVSEEVLVMSPYHRLPRLPLLVPPSSGLDYALRCIQGEAQNGQAEASPLKRGFAAPA